MPIDAAAAIAPFCVSCGNSISALYSLQVIIEERLFYRQPNITKAYRAVLSLMTGYRFDYLVAEPVIRRRGLP